jgi:hypothetical protein
LFGVDKNTAVLFPILLRLAQLIPILLGYVFLNREGVKLLDVTGSNAKRQNGKEELEGAAPIQQTVTPE